MIRQSQLDTVRHFLTACLNSNFDIALTKGETSGWSSPTCAQPYIRKLILSHFLQIQRGKDEYKLAATSEGGGGGGKKARKAKEKKDMDDLKKEVDLVSAKNRKLRLVFCLKPWTEGEQVLNNKTLL